MPEPGWESGETSNAILTPPTAVRRPALRGPFSFARAAPGTRGSSRGPVGEVIEVDAERARVRARRPDHDGGNGELRDREPSRAPTAGRAQRHAHQRRVRRRDEGADDACARGDDR